MSEPAKKKPKHGGSNGLQTNLFNFFGAPPPTVKKETTSETKTKSITTTAKENDLGGRPEKDKSDQVASDNDGIPDAIVPRLVPPPRDAVWQSLHDSHVIIRKPIKEKPRSKVAAFDLDGTLVCWSSSFAGFWPSNLTHYELWSSAVPKKLRDLHDDGYKLVLFSNQGGVRKAHEGKKATLVKNVIDWIANLVDRPIHAVLSTQSLKKAPDSSFHKPTPKMWKVATASLNKREEFDLSTSFFVGDSADVNDEQGGVDLRFAQAVGKENGGVLKFYSPTEYFGSSDSERRQKQTSLGRQASETIPQSALKCRSALLGGYLKGPVLVILCGVQGSGKSTFCQQLLESTNILETHWVHLSQDTINDGKPGKREKVESEARKALQQGHSVVVDRMHLNPEQRGYFVTVAKSVNVQVHVIVLNPPRNVIAKRVRERTNHAGKVQGEDGARQALSSLDKLVLPTYKEGVDLITCAQNNSGVARMAELYKGVVSECLVTTEFPTEVRLPTVQKATIPSIALGTLNMGKKKTKQCILSAFSAGIRAIDTSPTYKNVDRVGEALAETSLDIFCIAKIPKSVTQPEQVRDELYSTLQDLRRKSVDLLLLHWPCDVIASKTLSSVWKEMENCMKEGKCKALGVCNFNVDALAMLLSACSIPPAVNQVERHPLLPQMDLFDFCSRNNILLQAHTPLGQGKDELLAEPKIMQVAKETHMSPAQVVLRWNLQQGVLVVPKCSSEEHAMELVSTKMLTPSHMKILDSLDNAKRFVSPPFMYGSAIYCWKRK